MASRLGAQLSPGRQAGIEADMVAARAPLAACGSGNVSCEECDVRSLAVCAVLGRERLLQLTSIASWRRIAPGQTLFHEDDAAEEVFTLTQGMLKLYKLLSDGRRQIVGFLVPGDFFGLSFGRYYGFTAEAVTPTIVCRLRRAQFVELLGECPALEREVLSRATGELAAAQDQMLLLGRKNARERLASFLMALAHRRAPAAGTAMELPMSRADIADYLGLTIETVSRTFTQFRKERLVDLPATHLVVIRNRAIL